MLWPDTRVIPFHYPHPVTGERINGDDLRAPKFGTDVKESEPALGLDLPEGQSRPGARFGEDPKKGDRVLPEFVQNKVE